ncbi:hypothetical protein [Aurantiacibacter hainanensis]|uniref:hypothetical protein n=1 Tax=Aurantiacibacter hainanensis TaxID=3076114 RepID=UPI0030C71B2C
MTDRKRFPLRLGAVSALALALAACGPEDMASTDQLALTSALGPYNYSLDESAWDQGGPGTQYWAGGEGDYLPEAWPMQADYPGSYAPAPSWNYDQGGYYDDGYAGEWGQEDYGYYDAGYADDYYDSYGDEYYYDDTVGTDQYAWLALAALIGGLLADSPPDYGYYYDGAQPWAWRTHDGYYRYAEPVRGGYRYYYYEPRSARPFLVRDPLYSYGYRDDRLVVVYDRDGRILRHDRARDRRRVASAYFDRGERLYDAANRGDRFGVSAPLWNQRRREIVAEQRRWDRARERRQEWREWDAAHEEAAERRWTRERRARRSAADRFDRWQDAGYREEAPRFYRDRTENRPRIERAALVRNEARAERREQRRDIERVRERSERVDQRREERREARRGGPRAERDTGFARAETERVERTRNVERRRDAERVRRDREESRRDNQRRETVRQERAQREQAQRQNRQRDERADRDRQERQAAQRESRQRERAQQQREERQQAQRDRQRADRDRERAQNERRQQERAQAERRQNERAQQERRERQQAERQQQQRERAQRERRERQQAERQQQQQRERAQRERQERQQADRQRQQRESAQRDRRQQQARQNERRQRAESNRDRPRERGNGRGRGND